LIIADEPISALDVSIQAQVINLLNDIRHKMNLSILFIAHDLSVVKYFCDRIAVMYYGKIVETATSDELFKHPLHPYTKSLISAIPLPDPHYEKHRKRIVYNAALAHDYSVDKPSMQEVCPGHFVYCNSKEFAAYQEEIKALDAAASAAAPKSDVKADVKPAEVKAEKAETPVEEAVETKKPAKKAASKKKTEKK
jgi:ABC-type oligopeptide transport system ATPase subunit